MSDDRLPPPRIARVLPFYFKPAPGKTYLWCACGLSRNQPFCDGSHKVTLLEPIKYLAAADDKEVLFCGCKHTKTPPFCDGSHNNLGTGYQEDDPLSDSNCGKIRVLHPREGRLELNGNCYVSCVNQVPSGEIGNLLWRPIVTSETGAKHQSLFALEVRTGSSPVIAYGGAEVVLFVAAGEGDIEISGKTFPVRANSGVYVRAREVFRINTGGPDGLKIFASVCPPMSAPVLSETMLMNFDTTAPNRIVYVDSEKRQRMGDRTYQVLASTGVGSRVVTQFIGSIPLSKAVPHRHLYDEVLIILSGEGVVWTEDLKATVRAGDAVYLPSNQVHSLECTDAAGMQVVGVIYPGGTPNINY